MSSTIETLRRMSRDIARNLEYMGHDKAVLATANHIDMFWDPRMKSAIFADGRTGLSDIARAAIDHLAAGAHPLAPDDRSVGTDADQRLGRRAAERAQPAQPADRLQQVALPLAVGADDGGQRRGQRDLGRDVAAEVRQPDPIELHQITTPWRRRSRCTRSPAPRPGGPGGSPGGR